MQPASMASAGHTAGVGSSIASLLSRVLMDGFTASRQLTAPSAGPQSLGNGNCLHLPLLIICRFLMAQSRASRLAVVRHM